MRPKEIPVALAVVAALAFTGIATAQHLPDPGMEIDRENTAEERRTR